MSESVRPTMLCISTYEKGQAFLREAAALGCDVVLITVDKLRDADWPHDILAELHTMPEADVPENQSPERTLRIADGIARRRKISRVVALDEFDQEVASMVREHIRLVGRPGDGMGQTETRYFRDKLAMRLGAQAGGVVVPEFTSVLNDAECNAFHRWHEKVLGSSSHAGVPQRLASRKSRTQEEMWDALHTVWASCAQPSSDGVLCAG